MVEWGLLREGLHLNRVPQPELLLPYSALLEIDALDEGDQLLSS